MYTYRNMCHIPRNMRVTPAMAAGVTDRVWSLADLLAAALDAPAGEKPTAQPLVIPRPDAPARELPAGRGWLQLVKGSSSPERGPSPATPPAAPAVQAAAGSDVPEQLDLFAWKPPRHLDPIMTPADPSTR